MPLFFVYDVSARHSARDVAAWRAALDSVRHTELDGIFLCLWIGGLRDEEFVEGAGFDGAYTYFAAEGFTPGSDPKTWAEASRELAARGKFFVPSVGPGYEDTRIRPWNAHNVRGREGGKYYRRMWTAAAAVATRAVTVTSFNEWGEGTQIEAAVPHTSPNGTVYLDYAPREPDYYLRQTGEWAARFRGGPRRPPGCDAAA